MKVRIAMAGELPFDQHLFSQIDLLIGQISGYLCKNSSDQDIQILLSPSYTGGEWMNWNKNHVFTLCFYQMQDEVSPVESGVQVIRKDTRLRNLLGEAMCDKADAFIVTWNENVTELSGATWELMRIAYDRKTPCIWISTNTQNIYCLWDSYYKKYSPQYLETFSEPLPNEELMPMEAKWQNEHMLSFWEKQRMHYLKKYKADTAVHPIEEDCLMRQDFKMEKDAAEGEPIRQILLNKFQQFDTVAITWNSRFQAMIYQRSILPFIATIFLAVGFYAETLIGKTLPRVFPDFGKGIGTIASALAGVGFLIHGLLNFYVYRLSKNKHIEQWQKEFLYDRNIAELLRVLIHFLPYGVELNLRKLCAKDRKMYMSLKHLTDDAEPKEQSLNHKKIRYILQHINELLEEQMAYHKVSIGRYKNIVESLEKWGRIIFYIGFAVVLGRGCLQFVLAIFHITIGNDKMNWNNIVSSFMNMIALLIPAWAGYFSAKVQHNNFRYNLENHQNMLARLGTMHERTTNAMKQEDISFEIIEIMIEELAETMLLEDTLGWQQRYMGTTVKPL